MTGASFLWGALLCACFYLVSTTVARAQQQELDEIQQQIKQKQSAVKRELQRADAIQQQLKTTELAIANTAKALNRTQRSLADNQQQRKQLTSRQQRLQKDKLVQQQSLAKQLRSAYMAGNYDYAKMLLNQQDAGKFERTITYYQYLNNARKQQIDSIAELVSELDEVNLQLLERQQELTQLQQQQKQQRQQLTAQNAERKSMLTEIKQHIASEESSIEQLQQNEQALRDAIAEAQRKAELAAREQQTIVLNGLAALKGKLLVPTQGRIRKLFGVRRQGQVRWKGILINGNEGSAVAAVHHGKILYADWLKGFGLVTVLDHGQGYMSLYGHNQALLKQAGETVQAGETIALVGQSGGQSSPSLYFEIRHKGKALNPTRWLTNQ